MSTPARVLATIPLDTTPKWVSASPDGSRIYATSDFSAPGAVMVIDTASNAVVATLECGHASRVVVAPDGRRAYVANWGSPPGTAEVSVIDTDANAIVDHIQLTGAGPATAGTAITPDGRRLYVAMNLALESRGTVTAIDTATNAVLATITIGGFPAQAAMRPDGRFLYVFDEGGEDAAVIDTDSHDRTFGFPAAGAQLLAFTPDGRIAYAVRDNEFPVTVLDVAANKVITLSEASGRATDIAVTPDGRFVYATQRTNDRISRFEVGASPPIPTHPVTWSGTGDSIAMMPDGETAYVSDRSSRALHVIAVGPPP